jgi:hypothetical protein
MYLHDKKCYGLKRRRTPMLKILLLVALASFEARATFTAWNEESLKANYLAVRKSGFPKDINVPGSIKPHHEGFLWQVLSDNQLKKCWPMAIVLLGYIGDQKSIHKLINFADKNFEEWVKQEKWDMGHALMYALSGFSNRGFEEATEILFAGVKPGLWRSIIRERYPRMRGIEKIVEILTDTCVIGLTLLTNEKALAVLEELLDDPEYPYPDTVHRAISEIRERNSRKP